MSRKNDDDYWKEMANRWTSSIVSRSQISKFTGGLLTPRTMSNLDSAGFGPKNRIKMGGRSVGYPLSDLIEWLESRTLKVASKIPKDQVDNE